MINTSDISCSNLYPKHIRLRFTIKKKRASISSAPGGRDRRAFLFKFKTKYFARPNRIAREPNKRLWPQRLAFGVDCPVVAHSAAQHSPSKHKSATRRCCCPRRNCFNYKYNFEYRFFFPQYSLNHEQQQQFQSGESLWFVLRVHRRKGFVVLEHSTARLDERGWQKP